MGLLPTIFTFIFRRFFVLEADAWSQHKLQNWYFVFQIVFVILVTAVGTSLFEFARSLIQDPLSIFEVLSNALPSTTHFFMNYLLLQFSTNAMQLFRLPNLAKFVAWQELYGEEDAKKMSEPEDQDFYGIGSRSARCTILLGIGVVFGTYSPGILLLTLINFAGLRLIYGYLVTFAEMRKSDLGGVFWVSSLHHVQLLLFVYCVAMIGAVAGRGSDQSWWSMLALLPTLIVAPSFYARFVSAYRWDLLPVGTVRHTLTSSRHDVRKTKSDIPMDEMEEDELQVEHFTKLMMTKGLGLHRAGLKYEQPELMEDMELSIQSSPVSSRLPSHRSGNLTHRSGGIEKVQPIAEVPDSLPASSGERHHPDGQSISGAALEVKLGTTTSQPSTSQPTTSQPTTSQPITSQPTTSQPSTSPPTASQPTISQPTTS